jgi:hypothetical protein
MNQWLLAFLIFWLGTGAIVVAHDFAEAAKERAKNHGRMLMSVGSPE